MKLIAAAILCSLSGCGTTFYNSTTGKPEAIFSGNMAKVEYARNADGSMRRSADSVDHSTPTTAAGSAIQGNLGVVGTAVTAVTTIPAVVK